MTFIRFRRLIFQLHMWIGLVFGILLALLGLSGSAIVYDDEIAAFLNPPPQASAQGPVLPLDRLISAARDVAGAGQVQLSLPVQVGQAAVLRVGSVSRMGPMPEESNGASGHPAGGAAHRHRRMAQTPTGEGGPGRGLQVYVDPVSGKVLGSRRSVLPHFLAFAHQLHGNFLMGRAGRSDVVGWLGVAMCLLGLTGLVLWWPRRGQWKYAFLVRRTATGLRFHRELHGAVGIWIFIVFMAVSVSGVVLAWPQTLGANPPGFDPRALPSVTPGEGAPIDADAALRLAQEALPGAAPRSITLPARPDLPVSVSFLQGAVNASVLIDPYAGKVIAVRDPSGSFMAWQRPLHQGSLGPVWRFLVFLSGFVPALFVITGAAMWWKKYRYRLPMSAPLAETADT